jgi:ornithine carbamoyltransferase
MGQERETNERMPVLAPFQLNEGIVAATGKDPWIIHYLPSHREIEIMSAVLDSPKSIVFDQAEIRLHTEKALLVLLVR